MNSFQNIRGTFNVLWRAKDGERKEYRNLICLFPLSFTKTIHGKGSYFCFNVYLCFTSEVIHWRRKWQPTPAFLTGESQGWGNLVGCHLWGRQSRTRLKRLSSRAAAVKLFIGEGNGNPLQCSWLENPRDGGNHGLPTMGSHRVGHD